MQAWVQCETFVPPDFNGPVNRPFIRFDDAWISEPIIDRFNATASTHATRIAIVDRLQQLSYAELSRRVRQVAWQIRSHGTAGDRSPVAIVLSGDLYFPLAALACLAIGRPYVPIDPKYPPQRILNVLEDAGASVLLDSVGLPQQALPTDLQVINPAQINWQEDEETVENSMPSAADVSAPAVILYTSGSTGKPKGICNDQQAILQRVSEATNASHLNADDRIILLSSPGTIAGEREMFAALLNGATLYLCDPAADGLHAVLKLFSSAKITVCYAVPALFRMLMHAPGAAEALASLRVLRIGGDITLSSDLALFRQVAPAACHFFASFSATEMPAVFQWFVPPEFVPEGPRVPVGYARPEVDFAVLDEHGQPVQKGEIGELVVRSRFLALGQWQEGRLQPGAFTTDPTDPSVRTLPTGDMVRARDDGLWELTGRRDRQIKIHGQRIDTGELEAVLRSHPEIEDVAVIARRKDEQSVALVAFVVGKGGAQARSGLMEELRASLMQKLPRYMQPAQIHLLPAIPQLAGFKPDLAALRTMDERLQREDQQKSENSAAGEERAQRMSGELGTASGAPTSEMAGRVRRAVRHAWTMVLGANSYRMDLPFDQSGGDSLKALELWFHIEEALHFKLALDALGASTRPSVLEQALALELTRGDDKASANANAKDAMRGVPLIYLLPGILGDDPMQLRFRAAFGDSVRFKLVDYPNWRDTMASDCSFDAIVDATFERICADPAQAEYRLAGYSYGGIVAFELARRLIASGRKVGLLALLDSRRWDVAQTRPLWQKDAMLEEPNLHSRFLAGTITLMVRQRQYRLLTLICQQLAQRASRLAFRFRNRMSKDLRFEALRKWQAQPLPITPILYVSDSRWPGEPENYGWAPLCEDINIVHIGGTHASIIDHPGRERIASHILNLLQQQPGSAAAAAAAAAGTATGAQQTAPLP